MISFKLHGGLGSTKQRVGHENYAIDEDEKEGKNSDANDDDSHSTE